MNIHNRGQSVSTASYRRKYCREAAGNTPIQLHTFSALAMAPYAFEFVGGSQTRPQPYASWEH